VAGFVDHPNEEQVPGAEIGRHYVNFDAVNINQNLKKNVKV